MEALSLIDVSAEDDLFLGLASPPCAGFRVGGTEASPDLVPAGGSPAAASRAADPYGVTEDQSAPERAESPKQRKVKMGVKLRKSLAWDSAFFTSEGVLDTEELAIVNSTFRKTQGSRLPGITEESRRSGESTTSTLESESWVMESVETDLFHNVRASIQRSLGKPSKVTARPPASSKPPRATANAPRVAARKEVECMPQIKARSTASTSQGVGGKQRPQVTSKEPIAGRGNLSEDGEAKPSSRPVRALPRVATMRSSTNTSIASGISDKRSSTGGVGNRQDIGKSVNTSAGVRPCGVIKSSSIPKLGSLTASTTKTNAKTTSVIPSSTKRTAQRIPTCSSSKSDYSKTNPTRSSGNKIPARGHTEWTSLTISPNSSIDSMSSVISGASTASTIGKMSHTSEGFSSQSASLSPSLRKSNDNPPTTKLRPPPVVTEGQFLGTAASGDSLIATAGTTGKGKDSKPSGLRRPNPKIGYFDPGKSTDLVQSAKIQRLLPATPKSRLSSSRTTSAGASSFSDQEPKSTAPFELSGPSKSRAAKVLSVNVAQMDAVPFEVGEPEVRTHQTSPVVVQPEAEKCIAQTVSSQLQLQLQHMEIKCPLLATLNSEQSSMQTMILVSSPITQKVSKSTAVSHDEIIASTSDLAMVVPLKVAQIDVEPNPVAQMETIASTSELVKVAEPEACLYKTGPVVAEHEAEKFIDKRQGQPMEIQLSLPGTPNDHLSYTQTMNSAASTLIQQDFGLTEAPHEERIAKAGAEPLEVADLNVVKREVVKVVEKEAFMHQASPRVTTEEASKENIPASHQNIQANDDTSPLSVELLIQKLSSVSLGPTPDMTY